MSTMKPVLRMLLATTSLVALLLTVPRTANADALPIAACAPPFAPEAMPKIPLAGAIVVARRIAEGLVWDARFIVEVDTAVDFRGGVLALAVPLPPGEVLRATPNTRGVAAIVSGDRIVALCVGPDGIHDRTVLASFLQPVPLGPSLGAPIVPGQVVQIVDVASGNEARIDVSDPTFERHVGYVAPPTIGHDAREEARRLTETRARVTSSPIFVRGDDIQAAGGLAGHLLDQRERAKGSALGVGFVFAGIVAALVLAAQRLRRRAGIERADALLASAIDDAAAGAGRLR
jgi:hypothetical protein